MNSRLGNLGQEVYGPPAPGTAWNPGSQGTTVQLLDMQEASTAPAPAAPTGASAGEIMGGIGAILGPLVNAGVGIYAAQQQAKNQFRQAPGINYMPSYPPPPPQKSPALFIVLGLVALMMVGGMMFMMSKKGGGPPAYGPRPMQAPPAAVPFAYQAAPPPQRVRRRRRKRRRP